MCSKYPSSNGVHLFNSLSHFVCQTLVGTLCTTTARGFVSMRVCLYACVRAMLVLLTEDLEVNPEFVELTPFRCPVFHVRQLGYGYKSHH